MEAGTKIHIGTSGWHYPHWVGPFYLPDTGKEHFLTYYARVFHTVEINNSFYRLPEKETFEAWRKIVPDDFFFAVKASRFITHIKRLKDAEQSVRTFLERAAALENKLGPILFQLPPKLKLDVDRLRNFLQILPRSYRYAFEFRDSRWFHQDVYGALREYGAAFCIYDLAGVLSPKEITADFTYIRLHGPGAAYSGRYPVETLKEWARLLGGWSQQHIEGYCYFDNDQSGYAPTNARELQELIK